MGQSRAKPHSPAPGTARRQLRVSVVSAVLAWAAAAAAYVWSFTIDDAFISARYALRAARAGTYNFNDGPPTDGVTGPLWLLPLVVGTRLGFDPVGVAKGLGWLCCAGAFWLVARHAWARAQGNTCGSALALLIASAAPLWIWAMGGLETGAATLAVTALLLAAVQRPQPAPWAVGVSAAALAWLRPELAVLVGYALWLVALRARRAWLWAVVPAALGAGALLCFRLSSFGELLPLSAHAKPPGLRAGVAYVLRCAAQPAALALAPLLAFARGRRSDRQLAVALPLHAAAVALAGGDWMPGARLFVPLIPCACLLAAVGLTRVGLRRRALALSLLLALIGARTANFATECVRARAAGLAREQRLPVLLRALAGVADPIALLDIGAIGYMTGRTLIDLGGLTEPALAHAPGGHVSKRIDSEWLRRRAPGAIVLHSAQPPRVDGAGQLRWFAGYPVERGVLAMPWVWFGYRVARVVEYQPDYFYVLLVPRENRRP